MQVARPLNLLYIGKRLQLTYPLYIHDVAAAEIISKAFQISKDDFGFEVNLQKRQRWEKQTEEMSNTKVKTDT